MNIFISILLICFGLMILIIGCCELRKIYNFYSGIPLDNAIAIIIFFIMPGFALETTGFILLSNIILYT